jgi:gliding motility-associated-like protein
LFSIAALVVGESAFGQNLLNNGSFEFGGPGNGFIVDGQGYQQITQPFSGTTNPGDYAVHNNAYDLNPSIFYSIQDHTSGNGNMLLVDAINIGGNQAFWKAGNNGGGVCNLIVGQTYQLRYWLHSISSITTNTATCANIQFVFNNIQSSNPISTSFIAPLPVLGWVEYIIEFIPSNSCVNIALYDSNIGITGNDFAIDDIQILPPAEPLAIDYSLGEMNCSDSSSAFISLYAIGGTPPFSYQITNGISVFNNTTGNFNSLAAGNYDAQIIDDLGNTVASNGIVLQQGTYLEINPKDTSICPNSNITLTASGSPNNYNWSAIPVDPTLQFPNNATVSMAPGQTTTYTVSTNDLNVNLIYNGTFELGDQGFMSSYTSFYPNNPSGQQAAYGITNNASFWYNGFSPCVDHTYANGIGKMMVVDGATSGTNPFWEQNIQVEPNKNYNFHYFAQSLTTSNPSNVHVAFNGITQGIDTLSSTTCDWISYNYSWFSGADSILKIQLTDLNFSSIGNDFAVDDIHLSTLYSCTNNAVVQISTENLDLGLNYPINICKNSSEVSVQLNPMYPLNGTFNVIPAGLNVNPIDGTINPNNAGIGTYTIIYASQVCNQIQYDSSIVNIRPLPTLLQLSGGAYNCINQNFDPISLSANGGLSWSVYYSLNGQNQSLLNQNTMPLNLGNTPGNYILDSISDTYCTVVVAGTINLDTLEIPQIPQFAGDSIFCEDDLVGLITITNPNANGIITWYNDSSLSTPFGTGIEFYPGNEVTTVYYVTQTVNGCEGNPGNITIQILPCGFVIPSAFTPDNDGQNDVWDIIGIDAKYPENEIQIFNRWGEILYTSTKGDYSDSKWDGTFNKVLLPVGSYYYIINFSDDGSIKPINGTVSIIKKK